MDVKNTIAFVTGAASGLGLATCKALLAAGASVMAVDLDEERLAFFDHRASKVSWLVT